MGADFHRVQIIWEQKFSVIPDLGERFAQNWNSNTLCFVSVLKNFKPNCDAFCSTGKWCESILLCCKKLVQNSKKQSQKKKKKKKKIGPRHPEISDRKISNTLQTDTIEVPGRKLSIPVRSMNHLKRGLR